MATFRAADYINQGLLSVHNLMHVEDQKPSGTNGGDFISGAWRTRDLNTVVTNNIAGASLASNQVTLPAGEYWVEVQPVVYGVDHAKGRIYNVPDSSEILISLNIFVRQGNYDYNYATIAGYFALTAEKVIEVQCICSNTYTPYGFGNNSNIGDCERYLTLKIWKVG